jgi:hypothetical protein
MFLPCSLHVPCMFPLFPLNVPFMSTPCSPSCSLHVHSMFPPCPIYVPFMVPACSRMFPECCLNVP